MKSLQEYMGNLQEYIEESLLDDIDDLEKNADTGVDNAHKKTVREYINKIWKTRSSKSKFKDKYNKDIKVGDIVIGIDRADVRFGRIMSINRLGTKCCVDYLGIDDDSYMRTLVDSAGKFRYDVNCNEIIKVPELSDLKKIVAL